MFTTKGRLKVSLLVVGVLVVGLGRYGAFQVQEATANDSSASCLIKDDRIAESVVYLTSSQVLATRQKEVHCLNCPGTQKKKHTQEKVLVHWDVEEWYEHSWPWSSSWDHCHIHDTTAAAIFWETIPCGG